MAPPKSDQHRINDRIRVREVRLIGPDGSQLGIKAVPEALKMARGLDLDLVEVAANANPPVARIMDYGKFRYEEAQKAKEARKKSQHVSIKEVKFRPKIGKGDFDTKLRHLVDFIEEGHKVKVTLQFRGREMAHPELGRKILDGVIEGVGPIAKVESQARMEGRSMTLVLTPDKKAQDALKKAQADAEKQAIKDAETATFADDSDQVRVESADELVVEKAVEAAVEPAVELAGTAGEEIDTSVETSVETKVAKKTTKKIATEIATEIADEKGDE